MLTAALEVFTESGEAGFSVPAVSRRAGVSVGTVYRRFATKEDLLIAALGRWGVHEDATVMAGWDAKDWASIEPRAMIAELIRGLSRPWREEAPLMRAWMLRRLRIPRNDPVFNSNKITNRQATAYRVAVLHHREAICHPEPELAIEFSWRIITAACGRWTAQTIETQYPQPMCWPTMMSNLTDLVTIYLFGHSRSNKRND